MKQTVKHLAILCMMVSLSLVLTACNATMSKSTTSNAAGTAQGSSSSAVGDTVSSANPKEGEDKVFASAEMGFSFLYDAAHTAYITPTGAAELAVGGEKELVGLFVSVSDAENMPEISQIIEEGMFDETQKYLNAIAQPPAENELTIDGHTLLGYVFSYSSRQGKTIDSSYYVEKRDGKYVFYRTEVYRGSSDYWAGQEALEKAVRTIEFSADAYGSGDAALSGEIGSDNTPEQSEEPSATVSTSHLVGALFEGSYTFDVDDAKYLILADGELTMVYTGGGMEMPLFQVNDETDSIPFDSIGDRVVAEKNDIMSTMRCAIA